MKKYYISSITGQSGICKYAHDFYTLVLKEKGYLFIDSSDDLFWILTIISAADHVHIEIGIFQTKEVQILMAMLNAGYNNIDVTLHDAPLLKYPFHTFTNPLLNKLSKFYDIYINQFACSAPYLKKIKRIYVLSLKALVLMQSKYQLDNIHFLPHVVDTSEIISSKTDNNNFIYLGFIGRNKGIEYALQLHQQLLTIYPDSNFYVVGKALGKEQEFLHHLMKKYTVNVHFTGYVADEVLDEMFGQATFSLMPFKAYKFFMPFSGSILYNLKKGKIVFTCDTNAVSEIVSEGKTGFFLSGVIKEDVDTIAVVMRDKAMQHGVKKSVTGYLIHNHAASVVSSYLQEA
jgi:glycosyltransferase involved in cell wall biosynthesis